MAPCARAYRPKPACRALLRELFGGTSLRAGPEPTMDRFGIDAVIGSGRVCIYNDFRSILRWQSATELQRLDR
jgi:hypothetical protein